MLKPEQPSMIWEECVKKGAQAAEYQGSHQYRLSKILSSQAAKQFWLSGKISACSVKFFSDQGVIAGNDEERNLIGGISARDLYCSSTGARFCKQKGFGGKRPQEEICSGLLPDHMPSAASNK